MKMMKDQRGVTLMELLAAIIIFMIFGSIVWGFFFQSIKFNDVEVTKQDLQQEANLIINFLQQTHTKGITYSVTTNHDGSVLSIEGEDFNRQGIIYDISGSDPSPITGREFYFLLELKSKEYPNLSYKIETTFSRIR